ncbi:MAG: metallophosphoesterase family protein [bacterium]
MKIAVLSDIHGNLDALKSVMIDIDNLKADKIFICGDLAMAGPEPEETIDFIIELKKKREVIIIQGNTDEMIIKSTGSPDDGYTPPNEIMAVSLKYSQEILRADQKEFLFELPAQHKEKIGELEILAVHGSPRKNNEDILPNINEETLKKILGETREDLIFCGHTHIPVIYHVGKQTIVNAGSVGRPFTNETKACYAILDYPDLAEKKFHVNYRIVSYNYKLAADKLARLPFKGSEKLAQMLIKATSRYPE